MNRKKGDPKPFTILILLFVNSLKWALQLVAMPILNGVPGMALIQLEINQPQVFTAKCSEPQVENSNVGMKEVV